MQKWDIRDLRRAYERGDNISQLIVDRGGSKTDAMLYAYDLQAGSYNQLFDSARFADIYRRFCTKLAVLLDDSAPKTLLDAGTGECTTLAPCLAEMIHAPKDVAAIDISLSRLLHARCFLQRFRCKNVKLALAALDQLPFADNSIDVVLTVHAVEPNGGHEQRIITELLRITSRRLIMIEPCFEMGSESMRRRMLKLGYATGILQALAEIGVKPSRLEKWGVDFNPDNEAALIIVDKGGRSTRAIAFSSPISHYPLIRSEGCLYSPSDGLAFPIISGIPCLTTQGAILATALGKLDGRDAF